MSAGGFLCAVPPEFFRAFSGVFRGLSAGHSPRLTFAAGSAGGNVWWSAGRGAGAVFSWIGARWYNADAMKVEHEIRDPIHGFIHLSGDEMRIVSAPFQRLRSIRQLALLSTPARLTPASSIPSA